MPDYAQKTKKLRITTIEFALCLVLLFFIFRLTAAAALLILLLLYVFFPLHQSCRALVVSYILFFTALLIPVDIYVPGFHGPLENSQHSGPRFVRVLYGLGAHRIDGGEFIAGGCIVGLNDTKWRFVWD